METNNTNHAGIIGVIIVLLIIVIGAGTYLYYDKAMAPIKPEVVETEDSPLASNCGLTVQSPSKNAKVSFPVTVTGTIDNTNADATGCSWTMFEGQAGKAELYYETKDGYSLPVDTKPLTVANWMTTSTTFSVTLNFDNKMLQLPAGYNFKIVLTEEDPSGNGDVDIVELPVVLQ